jgi:hypothetical protein
MVVQAPSAEPEPRAHLTAEQIAARRHALTRPVHVWVNYTGFKDERSTRPGLLIARRRHVRGQVWEGLCIVADLWSPSHGGAGGFEVKWVIESCIRRARN